MPEKVLSMILKSFGLSRAYVKTPWKGFTNDQSKQPLTAPYTGKVGVISQKKLNKNKS